MIPCVILPHSSDYDCGIRYHRHRSIGNSKIGRAQCNKASPSIIFISVYGPRALTPAQHPTWKINGPRITDRVPIHGPRISRNWSWPWTLSRNRGGGQKEGEEGEEGCVLAHIDHQFTTENLWPEVAALTEVTVVCPGMTDQVCPGWIEKVVPLPIRAAGLTGST